MLVRWRAWPPALLGWVRAPGCVHGGGGLPAAAGPQYICSTMKKSRMSGTCRVLAALALTWSAGTGVARATYSIAAVDQSTQQVGGAVTSCVGSLDVGVVYGALPGVGVIHAQAQLDQRGRAKTRALELLMQGVAPSDIIQQITAASFDSAFASRQYGIVDLVGRSAGFTGAQAQAYKRDQQGQSGSFVYSVQGNILTSQKVLDQAADAFAASGCDLAERLMLALEAGAANGEGDSRCTRNGIPSDSAFIEVDLPGQAAGSYLKLSVRGTAPQSPLVPLRMQFDAWRRTHPCGGAAAGRGGQSGAGGTVGGPGAGGKNAAASGGSAATDAGAAAPGAATAGANASAAGAAANGASGAAGTGASGAAGTGASGAATGATGSGATGASGAAATGAGGGAATGASGATADASSSQSTGAGANAAASGATGALTAGSRAASGGAFGAASAGTSAGGASGASGASAAGRPAQPPSAANGGTGTAQSAVQTPPNPEASSSCTCTLATRQLRPSTTSLIPLLALALLRIRRRRARRRP